MFTNGIVKRSNINYAMICLSVIVLVLMFSQILITQDRLLTIDPAALQNLQQERLSDIENQILEEIQRRARDEFEIFHSQELIDEREKENFTRRREWEMMRELQQKIIEHEERSIAVQYASPQDVPVIEQDRAALVALYNATNGDNWWMRDNWLTDEPVGTWYGVTVEGDRVTGIIFPWGNNLTGTLPAELGDLTNLEILNPGLNWDLGGAIPPELGNLENLRELRLNNNHSDGIPQELRDLTNIEILDLGGNWQLGGPIPAWLEELQNLRELRLNNNGHTGDIPAELVGLINLEVLVLGENWNIGGPIPDWLGDMENLRELRLTNNGHTGDIPAELVGLINLEVLALGGNWQLGGPIPDWLGDMENLRELRLNNNGHTGGIPLTLGGLKNLEILNLGGNWNLGGPIPASLGDMENLRILNLTSNNHTGDVPDDINKLTNLEELYLTDNHLESFPDISNFQNLAILEIQNNRLTFESIEPNIGVVHWHFWYSPQANIGEERSESIVEGEPFIIEYEVGGINNVYQWLKNDEEIPDATSDTYTIQSMSLDDAGVYILRITNTLAPDLILYSNPVTLGKMNTVTFYVDLSGFVGLNPDTDDVYISGSFAGWPQPGTDPDYKMKPTNANPLIYELTMELTTGVHEYKFFRVIGGTPTWDHGEWGGDPNRSVEITDDTYAYNRWAELEYDAMSIVMARDILPEGSEVTIEGIVTRVKGDFTRIQDETAGFVIRSTEGRDWHNDVEAGEIRDGDRMRVTGITSTFAQLWQINNDALIEYERIDRDQALPEPVILTLEEIASNGSQYQSMLIFVHELEIDNSGDHVFAQNKSYQIKDPTLGFGEVDFRVPWNYDSELPGESIPGEAFSFRGVLGQFDMESADEGFQLVAIYNTDIVEPEFVNVQFRVDMADQVDAGRFNPDNDMVVMRGDFPLLLDPPGEDWEGNEYVLGHTPHDESDHAYSLTVEFPSTAVGEEIEWKYVIVPGVGEDIWESDPNRSYTITAETDQILPLVRFFYMVLPDSEWEFAGVFPDSTSSANTANGLAVDNDGKVWIGPYNSTLLFEDYDRNVLYIFDQGGTPADFSPIYQYYVNGDTLRFGPITGMNRDHEGNILVAIHGTRPTEDGSTWDQSTAHILRIDPMTGDLMGLVDVTYMRTEAVAHAPNRPAVTSDGYIVVSFVFPGSPIIILDPDFQFVQTVTHNEKTGFSRSLEVSRDGKYIFQPGYSDEYITVYYSGLGVFGEYEVVGTTLAEGMRPGAINRDPLDDNVLWVTATGGAYDQLPETSPYYGHDDKVFAIDLMTHNIVDYVSSPGPFRIPRSLAFSPDGNALYVGTFTDNVPSVHKFTKGTVIIDPPAPPLLSEPENNARGISRDTTLVWFRSEGAATYNLLMTDNDEFNIDVEALTDTTYNITGLQYSTEYEWKVRAKNQGGYGDWSDTFSFTTLTVPEPPKLVSPRNDATGVGRSPRLRWNSSEFAASYDIRITDNNGLDIDVEGLADTTYLLADLEYQTQYEWRVRAENEVGKGVWSGLFRFTTITPPKVEEVKEAPEGENVTVQYEESNIQFTGNVQTSSTVTVQVYEEPPYPGENPPGVFQVGNTHIVMSGGEELDFNSGFLRIPLDQLPEGFDPADLTMLKRNASGDEWIDLGGEIQGDYFVNTIPFDGFSEFSFGRTGVLTYDTPAAPGWNLIGLPLEVFDDHYKTLFPNAIDGTLYSFNGSYNPETLMETGSGYWLRFSAGETVEIIGLPIDELTIPLTMGWNMISGLSDEFVFGSIDDPGNVVIDNTLYKFDGSYQQTDKLMPGKGYWIRASADGTIGLSSGAGVPGSIAKTAAVDGAQLISALEVFDRIEVQDAAGMERTIYFGDILPKEIRRESFSLPPVPPGGAFDARFSDGYYLSESNEATIQLQGESYPLSLTFYSSSVDETIEYIVTEKDGVEHRVITGESIELTDPDVRMVLIQRIGGVAEKLLPKEFSLSQNYPNPFNPSTTIEYALPKDSYVSLEIYNMLGQRVEVLVNEEQQAGYHRVVFDATKLPSGVYVYRIKAQDFVDVKKLVFLK